MSRLYRLSIDIVNLNFRPKLQPQPGRNTIDAEIRYAAIPLNHLNHHIWSSCYLESNLHVDVTAESAFLDLNLHIHFVEERFHFRKVS
jgi:hypothetical protein